MKLGSGIHELSEREYHADPCTTPSLSSSIAKILDRQSPLHAWTAHPRLNPRYEPKVASHFDFGTAVHSFLLKGQNVMSVVDAKDWRTSDAQEQRDAAREAGLIPVLKSDYERVLDVGDAIYEQIHAHNAEPPLLANGKPEQTVIWEEDGIMLRCRPDWLRDTFTFVDDLKTTARSANPPGFVKTFYDLGYDLQAAFYIRGIHAVTGITSAFRFVVVEGTEPHAITVFQLAPDALDLANAKVDRAIALWRECLAKNQWPGYARDVHHVEAPGWDVARFMEREELEAA